MVAIAVALYDEAYEIIRDLDFKKAEGYRHYQGQILGKQVSLFLTKPQITSRVSFRRWLAEQNFSQVILCGYAGSLQKEFILGEAFLAKKISALGSVPLFASLADTHNSTSFFQVDFPVFAYREKEEIRIREQAGLIDMESYTFINEFCNLHAQKKISSQASAYILKIVGERSNEEKIMRQEFYFRAFFREKKMLGKLKIVFKTGLISSIRLYRRKRFLQKKLKKEVYKLIASFKNMV